MVGSNASRLSSSDGREGDSGWEWKFPMILYPFALASLSGFKLFFRIHGEVFSAGIYVCKEIDFCDSDLLIFFGSCKEAAGLVRKTGCTVFQDGGVIRFFQI